MAKLPEVNKLTITTLTMSEKQRVWLRGNMQNPLHGQTPDEETEEDYKMRLAFFKALGDTSNEH